MKTFFRCLRYILILAMVLPIVSCSTKRILPTEKERQNARMKTPCILVLPVKTVVNQDKNVNYQKAAELEKGAEFMDTVIREEMVGRSHVRTLSARQLETLLPTAAGSQQEIARVVGSELKCDAVFFTVLNRYQQRVGGEYGADSPASTAFTMQLIDSRDGRLLWSITFDETQEFLTSNLWSFGKAYERGFKWITVEQLVRQAIHEKLEECPYF